MKRTKTKLLCLLLAALMLLGLTACGKDKESTDKELADSNLLKLGDYELRYMGLGLYEQRRGQSFLSLVDLRNSHAERCGAGGCHRLFQSGLL